MQSWKLRDVKGLRADVIAAIEAAEDIPESDKTFLKARVNAMPEEIQGVSLDAYVTFDPKRKTWLCDMSITPLF